MSDLQTRFGGSMLNRWKRMYSTKKAQGKPAPYDASPTYELAARWLRDCATVEDWGCGRGWARQYFRPDQYVGLDCTATPHTDKVVDLREYRSQVDGVYMRHVLEHNVDWRLVLDNALASAQQRAAIVFFTPFADQTQMIKQASGWVKVPDMQFARADIEDPIRSAGGTFTVEDLDSPTTQYGVESLYLIEFR